MYKNIKRSGFSLLEMSIVLLIVSIIITSGLLILNKYSAQGQVTETEVRLEQVMSAIKQFAIKYNRLPCPADPSLTMDNANYGLEKWGGAATCNIAGVTAYQGMVPVSTLNVYPTMATDGWNRRFKYVVRKDYINTNGLAAELSEIKLYNSQNINPYHDVVVAVLSFGQNGLGAHSGRGGAAASSGGATSEEISNIQNDDGLFAFPPFNGFDDIVGFWTYEQIKKSDLME